MLCSRHVSLPFSVVVLFVLFLLYSHVLVLFLSFVVCVSPSCVVCAWVWAFAVVVVAAQAPYSKVVSWLFVPSILAQAPLGGFLAGAVFPRMGRTLSVHLAQVLT